MSAIGAPSPRGAYVVAIDNGSQSTKVAVVDAHGRVHASAQRRLRPYAGGGAGRAVHPDDDLWTSIRETCAAALARFPGDRSALVGVGLCTIRFCRAFLDEDGMLTEPVLSWMDERVDQTYPGEQRTRFVTSSSGYITHRLTGQRRDASGNYQGRWPIDQDTWRWAADPGAYLRTGIPRDRLFELVDPGGLLGTVTAEAADATGLPAGLPVFATANDKAVEALGSGLRTEEGLLLSLGTYIAAMTVGHGSPAGGGVWRNFGAVPGEYLFESEGIRRGMWTVSWFRDVVGDTGEDDLNAGAGRVPIGSCGLLTLLDWLAPASAPHRRGALLGFDGRQGRYEIYRSILEGIACTMSEHAGRLASALGRTFDHVVVSGGGARSAVMMQMIADVFGLPARRMAITDGALLGAAITAAVGSGIQPNWEEAVDAMVQVDADFDPIPANVQAYGPVRAAHRAVTTYTDPLFEALAGASHAEELRAAGLQSEERTGFQTLRVRR